MADYVDAVLQQSSLNSAWAADQAQMNRDWQEYMSGTSHQREVNDLIAAGLNPVLSANSGSTWQAVGNAIPDTSGAQALGNLAATVLNNQASIEMSKIAAGAQIAAASSAASIAADATRDAARTNADANIEIGKMNVEKELMTNPISFSMAMLDGATGGSGSTQWQNSFNKYVSG